VHLKAAGYVIISAMHVVAEPDAADPAFGAIAIRDGVAQVEDRALPNADAG